MENLFNKMIYSPTQEQAENSKWQKGRKKDNMFLFLFLFFFKYR